MMKLILKSAYKSITLEDRKSIESAEFPDLCFITGKNGSGKTHLLEAINRNAIFIENGNSSDYGPTIYVDYHTVSFKGEMFYGSGNNQFFQKIKGMRIQINESFGLGDFGFTAIANDVLLAARIIEKIIQSPEEITSINQIQDLGRYELRKIDRILNNREPRNKIKIDTLCKNLLQIYTQNKKFLLSIKDNFPHTTLEEVLYGLYDRYKHLKINLYNSYKNYLKMRGNIFLENMKERKYPSDEEILAKCGECPLDSLNRIFKVSNYSFDTDQVNKDVHTVMQMNDNDISKYTPILKLRKGNLDLDLDDLSSGEKVILSLSLLILESNISNGEKYQVLLLDEIETNLHPSMLQSFLGLIQDSFIKEFGLKVFLVTHSPSTIAFAPEGSVFVMRGKNDAGKRLEKTTNEYAVNTLTEGFATIDKGIHLFDQVAREKISIITEGNNTQYIEKALSFYYEGDDIGILTGAEGRSGKNILKTLFQLFTRFNHNNKVIFVFDCDTAQEMSSLKDENNTYAFVFEKNEENDKVKKGIENLFPKERFLDEFYTQKPLDDGGQTEHLDKNCFMDFMLNDGTEQDFAKFRPLIDKINELKKG
ncbi:MAG: AAA family ATPase [Salinispira sp.]